MAKKNELDAMLEANPRAKRDKRIIREALRQVRRLRAEGIGGRGYSLMPPFGEKGATRRQESALNRPRGRGFKMTEDA
jgi:hypothetical protein